MFSFSSALI